MRLLLIGNYGVGNAGDDILREYFLQSFPSIEWKVLSADWKEDSSRYPFLPTGLRSLLSFRWLRTLRILFQCDGVVFGGGTLFTDHESLRACWIWFIHSCFARIAGKPLLFAFQGIGPFRTRVGELLARRAIRHALFVSVRDEASLRRVRQWKTNPKIVQSFDPSILLLYKQKTIQRTQNVFTFIPRFSTGQMLGDIVISLLESLRKHGASVCVLSLQPGDPCEQAFCQRLAQVCALEVHFAATLQEAPEILAGSRVLTERYHGGIAAMIAGCPFVALSSAREDKLDVLAVQSGQIARSLRTITAEEILQLPWSAYEESIQSYLEECLQHARDGEKALRRAFEEVGVC